MLEKFSKLINKLLDKISFRARFLLFSLIYVMCVPMPFYWFIVDQNIYIDNAETQAEHLKQQKIWNRLLNHVIEYQINSVLDNDPVSSMEYNKLVLTDLNALKNHDNEAEDTSIEKIWDQISSSPAQDLQTLIKLIQEKIRALALTNEHSMINIYHENKIINTLLNRLSILQIASVQAYMPEPKRLYFNQYLIKTYVERIEELLNNNFLLQKFLEDPNFLKLQENSQNLSNYLKKLMLWSRQLSINGKQSSLSELKELLEENKNLTQAFIQYGIQTQEYHTNLHRLIEYICIIFTIIAFLLVIGSVIFHALTSHFLALNAHIIAFSKGKFKKCFCSQSKDEFGPVGMALDKMASVVQEVVAELQRLGRQLGESVKQISLTTDEQNVAFQNDEKKIKDVEEYTKSIASRTQSLAKTMNELTFNTEQNILSEKAKSTLEKMGAKMLSLKSRSTQILQHLNELKSKLEGNKKIFDFLTKISNQASLLSLNSAIEASNIVTNRQSFNKITQEIKRFSEKTASSSDDVQKIIKGLFKHIDLIHNNTNDFFDELNASIEKLNLVETHLSAMAQMIGSQTGKFQTVNKIMQDQARIVEEIRKSLDSLVKVANENSSGTQHLGQTMTDLNIIANKLQQVLGLFFHPKQIKKLVNSNYDI
jgi:methyl-accepting chemotaxis protein WspA